MMFIKIQLLQFVQQSAIKQKLASIKQKEQSLNFKFKKLFL
jgi:hypothetical protein